MYNLQQLEKQQIGLRLPKYLIDEIDIFTQQFSLNRTDIVIEALRSYIAEQKSKIFYSNFDNACKEVKAIWSGELSATTLGDLIDELDDNSNT